MYPYVDVKVTYLDKPLSKEYFDEHKEIHHLYPSRQSFNGLYRTLIDKIQKEGTEQLLEISESSIKVNGKPVTIK